MLDKKPTRFIGQQVSKAPDDLRADLYGNIIGNIVFGSQSNSHYVDVISIGEIGGVEEVYLDDTAFSTGEFPDSTIYVHNGATATSPWAGNFPYAERTIALSKNAEIQELGRGTLSETVFTKSVSSLGVVGLRLNFTTSGFTHKDDQGREKVAQAVFIVSVLDENGNEVKSEISDYRYFSAKNPTAVQLYITPPDGYESRHWSYIVSMGIRGYYYGVNVSGIWAASTVTEVYKDTQTYENIAFSSGTIVASDVSGSIPVRQYLASGYKVLIPTYQEIAGSQVLTGEYERATSNSHAWNALAVLTDTLWGGGLSLDKIDLVSFAEFEEYCAEEINGVRRFSYSQYLIKSDNYYKLASEIVGAADGRLYEDTSGRIGVLIDKQTNKRRVITSYDIVDEKVKRTTVSENSKTNYVQGTYDDEDNIYSSTIIFTEDSASITANGLISEKLTLNTCTNTKEAERTIKKVLTTSQYTTSSYVFKVGHTHEDIQIGEVVELYDRLYSNINYCGKVFAGSTTTTIVVDPRTPINLTGLKSPVFTIDNSRGVPIKRAIASWTDTSITLSEALPSTPADFTSFGVDDADETGIKPTLIRVLGVDDTGGVLSIEGVEYVDSLYSHVDYDTPLVTYKHRYIPDQQLIGITGLYITQTLSGLTAAWDTISGGYEYGYIWKVTPNTTGVSQVITIGTATGSSTSLPKPLTESTYQIQVFPVLSGEQVGDSVVATIAVSSTIGSVLPKPTDLVVIQEDGTTSDKYLSNSFKIGWSQVESSGGVDISHFKLRLTQNSVMKEVVLDGSLREYTFTSAQLKDYFGAYSRQFAVELVSIDSELKATDATQLTITNTTPPVPNVSITDIGSISLSYSPSIPEDIIGAKVYLWEGTSVSESVPVDAKVLVSKNPLGVSIPEGVVKTDGTPYVFDIRWIDGFGDSELSAKTVFMFNPDEQIPDSPEITSITPIDSQSVLVNFTHNGDYLTKIKASYRLLGSGTWVELSEIFNIPPSGTNNTYDQLTEVGYVKVSGLVRNFTYEFKLNAANVASSYSEDSNTLNGSPYLDVLKPDDLPTAEEIRNTVDDVGLLDVRALLVEGVSHILGEGVHAASIVENRSAIVTETDARVASFEEISATSALNSSRITNAQLAITAESTARATAISELAVSVGENFSEISTTRDALATEVEARTTAIEEMLVLVDENSASIISSNQAIVDEANARATAITQLTTQVGNDISLVDQAAKAAIGYCTIGGSTSSHETKNLCENAGGTWVNSTLASATRTVQVSSGGDTATVGDFFEAYKDLEGNINGKAVIGVDVNGKWTGMTVVGGATLNKITFQGDAIEFQDSAGQSALYWDENDDTWKFAGSLDVGVQITSPVITGGFISSPTISGGSFELVGTSYMKYQSSTPFGVHSLIEWYGPKVNGTTWDTTTLRPIPSGMTKSNATSYLDSTGKAYFGGGIIAGDFRNALTTTENSSTATSPSLIFGSNGGLIDIVLTGSMSGSFLNTNSTPSAGSGVASFTIVLEKKVGTTWATVATLYEEGEWTVYAEGTDRIGDMYCTGSITHTDSDQSLDQREYRARMITRSVGSVPAKNQSISIITAEFNT